MNRLTTADLEAYLNEELPAEEAAEIEEQIRHQPELKETLLDILSRRDAGIHSLGEIWRRNHVTCPGRPKLQHFLLGVLEDDESAYITFHLNIIGCRWCAANLADLQAAADQSEEEAQRSEREMRRRKYFTSSVGHLHRDSDC